MWPCCDITSADDDEHNTGSHTLALREARALRVPELYVLICVHTHSAALPRFSLWCLRLLTSVLRWKSIRM